jgi:D-xylose transport system substrate-binding protein
MTPRNLLVVVSLVLSVLLGLVLGRGGPQGEASRAGTDGGRVTIGLSLDSLKEARWQADRDLFVRRAGELGADVVVLAANGDDAVQIGDVEKLLTRGIDVLVIVPHDGKAMAKAVRLAH